MLDMKHILFLAFKEIIFASVRKYEKLRIVKSIQSLNHFMPSLEVKRILNIYQKQFSYAQYDSLIKTVFDILVTVFSNRLFLSCKRPNSNSSKTFLAVIYLSKNILTIIYNFFMTNQSKFGHLLSEMVLHDLISMYLQTFPGIFFAFFSNLFYNRICIFLLKNYYNRFIVILSLFTCYQFICSNRVSYKISLPERFSQNSTLIEKIKSVVSRIGNKNIKFLFSAAKSSFTTEVNQFGGYGSFSILLPDDLDENEICACIAEKFFNDVYNRGLYTIITQFVVRFILYKIILMLFYFNGSAGNYDSIFVKNINILHFIKDACFLAKSLIEHQNFKRVDQYLISQGYGQALFSSIAKTMKKKFIDKRSEKLSILDLQNIERLYCIKNKSAL